MAFASDGRKNGEGAASGTGVAVVHDGTARGRHYGDGGRMNAFDRSTHYIIAVHPETREQIHVPLEQLGALAIAEAQKVTAGGLTEHDIKPLIGRIGALEQVASVRQYDPNPV